MFFLYFQSYFDVWDILEGKKVDKLEMKDQLIQQIFVNDGILFVFSVDCKFSDNKLFITNLEYKQQVNK
jgi:hypothetical protein